MPKPINNDKHDKQNSSIDSIDLKNKGGTINKGMSTSAIIKMIILLLIILISVYLVFYYFFL